MKDFLGGVWGVGGYVWGMLYSMLYSVLVGAEVYQ